MSGRRWDEDDDAEIVLAVRTRGPSRETWDWVADELGRTSNAVQLRACHILKKRVQAAEKEWLAQQKAAAPSPDRPDPTASEILRLERALQSSEADRKDLERKIKALHKDASLFEQVAGVVREVVQPLPTVRSSTAVGRSPAGSGPGVAAGDRTPCDGVLILSDEHSDEVASREATWGLEFYNFDIFRCRLERLRDLVRDYATVHLPRHHFERLWIFKLGDSVQGDIHQATAKNHFGSSIKAAVACGDAEAQFIQSLLPYFPLGVHVVGVSGNHGRLDTKIKKDFGGPHENWDWLVGVQIATRLQAEIEAGRCTVTLPNAWSAYVEVRNMLWALNHGDTVTSYVGLPFVGFDRRNNKVQTLLGTVNRRADAFAAGHYHIPANFPSGGAVSFHSGCWTAAESYAINQLAAGGEPQQYFIVVGDKPKTRGILLPIPIYTRHEEREAAFLNGEWVPALGESTALDFVEGPRSEGLHIIGAP